MSNQLARTKNTSMTKINCDCGGKYTPNGKSEHFKTKTAIKGLYKIKPV